MCHSRSTVFVTWRQCARPSNTRFLGPPHSPSQRQFDRFSGYAWPKHRMMGKCFMFPFYVLVRLNKSMSQCMKKATGTVDNIRDESAPLHCARNTVQLLCRKILVNISSFTCFANLRSHCKHAKALSIFRACIVTMTTNFEQNLRYDLYSTRWHFATDSNITIPICRC